MLEYLQLEEEAGAKTREKKVAERTRKRGEVIKRGIKQFGIVV